VGDGLTMSLNLSDSFNYCVCFKLSCSSVSSPKDFSIVSFSLEFCIENLVMLIQQLKVEQSIPNSAANCNYFLSTEAYRADIYLYVKGRNTNFYKILTADRRFCCERAAPTSSNYCDPASTQRSHSSI